ncbi:hypothetical protein [Streptomyces sp. NPDC093589]|uniref:hypothetical protein n=1 Tax=Streptomyces sp. NPDC093589 TaxID=3366043 RepID=UPI00380D147B
MPTWLTAVLPVASALLGAAGAFAGIWFTQSRQDRREQQARDHERAKAIVERREQFELEHLVEFNALFRALHHAASHYFWLMGDGTEAHPRTEGEEWESARESVRGAYESVISQIGFVLDDTIRECARSVAADVQFRGVPHPQFGAAGRARARELDVKCVEVYERLSARVREIYANRL